ncbi:MAG: TonB-dependent receptor [Bacteroidota bacterium]
MKYIKIASWFLTLTLLISQSSFAQKGTIRGKVSSASSGEALQGATIRLVANGQIRGGAYSDIEGSYTLKAVEGSYDLIVSFISFLNDTIRDVTVTAGQVSIHESVLFEENAVREDLAVEIVAKRDEASNVAFLAKKQNHVNAIDGITFDLVQRTGDANAAAAIRRVVGVTVEGGKYVYVRGLGDRYSKTMLNGAELPGLDPNRNTIQMDIFPSNLIDNIVVYKNFTPDLPGSFTGGLVDIRTKDFPAKFTMKVSASTSFNDQASLNENFLTDETYEGEWSGAANEIRSLPAYISEELNGRLPNRLPTSRNELTSIGLPMEQATRSFVTDIEPIRQTSGINQRYEVSLGNQHSIGERPFGYIASLSYRKNYSYFNNGRRSQYSLPSEGSALLNPEAELTGESGQEEVLWGGLIKLSYKPWNKHKFSINAMRNQSGTLSGELFRGPFFSSGGDIFLETRTTSFTERYLNVIQAQGEHAFGPLHADWIVSKTDVMQDEPDLRFFANEIEGVGTPDSSFNINNGNGYSNPLRFYRRLEENNLDARLNVKLEIPGLGTSAEKGSIRVGAAYTTKARNFSESRYEIAKGRHAERFNGNVNEYLDESNLISVPLDETGTPIPREFFEGLYYIDATRVTNIFEADQTVAAAYLMTELPIGNRLRAVAGARYEDTDAQIFPRDTTLLDDLRKENPDAGTLDLQDILPSISLIFKANEKMNIRSGYSRTLARPTVVELSPFQRLPYIGGPEYLGNPELERTLIDNYDLRWEWFFSITEMVSVSGFYKNFTNPIGLGQDFSTQNLRFKYVNRPSAYVAGLELEFKKNFGFISESLSKLQFGGNASFVHSETELLAREIELIRTLDPDRPTTIPLFGQSPYVFNAELAYIDNEELGLQASASFNVFGPRLFAVGGGAPDIYEQPRPSLNVSVSKDIGKYFSVRVRANNLLNPEYNYTQEFKGETYLFRSNTVGRNFSVGVSFNI